VDEGVGTGRVDDQFIIVSVIAQQSQMRACFDPSGVRRGVVRWFVESSDALNQPLVIKTWHRDTGKTIWQKRCSGSFVVSSRQMLQFHQ
jgi:hypothetical protein